MDGLDLRSPAFEDGLRTFLPKQRWFAGKARVIDAARVADSTLAGTLPFGLRIAIVEAAYGDGSSERYLLSLARSEGEPASEVMGQLPGEVIAEVEGARLIDATVTDAFAGWLLDFIDRAGSIATELGEIRARRSAAFDAARGSRSEELPPIRMRGEQSNTSVRYGDRLILKLFRRLQEGENPEAEIGRFLTERTTFDRAPKTVGTIEYEGCGWATGTLAILQELVPSKSVGWDHMLSRVGRFYRHAESRLDRLAAIGVPEIGVADLLGFSGSERLMPRTRVLGRWLADAERLGRRTAEMHRALSCDSEDEVFAPERIGAEDLADVAEGTAGQLQRVVAMLGERLDVLDDETRAIADVVIRNADRMLAGLREVEPLDGAAVKIRCHGDYHLGQVLWTGEDYFILDFEGEPAKPLAERRKKHSPVKDVVGMLRSFDYAAFAGLFTFTVDRPGLFEKVEPAALGWSCWVGAVFLRGYRTAIGSGELFPSSSTDAANLMRLYTLDKALYELAYELNNRPDWVRIPLRAVAGLVRGA